MKKNSLIILLFLTQITFCQNKKNIIYSDFNNQILSLSEFEKLDKRKIYIKIFENDSSIIKRVYSHKNISKFDTIQLRQIRMILSEITNQAFDENKKTMIHLYRKKDENIKKDSKNKKYWKWIRKNSEKYQSFLIGTENSSILPDNKNQILIDYRNQIENLFFTKSEFEINHLFIKPNGQIYIYYGMKDILSVLDWSVD